MNKLIIIGNGFDLAHGLKTSYGDFIKHYLNSVIDWDTSSGIFEDRFLLIKYSSSERGEAITHRKNRDAISWIKTTISEVSCKSLLFKRIYDQLHSNWVDIENEFFNLIVEQEDNIDNILTLNDDFDFLREKLIEYLKNIEQETQVYQIDKFCNLFTSGINIGTDRICFLNFNYTTTLNRYLDSLKNPKSKTQIINIHGSLDGTSGNPIFGIGDEHHEKYNEFKDHPYLSTILKFSKSFLYQRNNNHKKLELFLAPIPRRIRRKFSIEIYGHSCGLSDRTLLKYLFQHQDCKSITIFHHENEENYVERSFDIWRHFDDSQKFRERLNPYEPENIMPQIVSRQISDPNN